MEWTAGYIFGVLVGLWLGLVIGKAIWMPRNESESPYSEPMKQGTGKGTPE